jgi:hypothetical protein
MKFMKKTISILSAAVLAILIGATYPLITLGQIVIDPNGDLQCEGQIGVAYGLCTAGYALGCDKKDRPGCDKVAENFEKITGQTPPWIREGCFDNLDCGEGGFFDPYCSKPVGKCEGPGTCQRRPDICSTVYEPVCGCDGVTYTNQCNANANGFSVAYFFDKTENPEPGSPCSLP